MRRDTIGTKPCFDLILLSSTLGDEELNHPVLLALEELSTDMIVRTNVRALQSHRLSISLAGWNLNLWYRISVPITWSNPAERTIIILSP